MMSWQQNWKISDSSGSEEDDEQGFVNFHELQVYINVRKIFARCKWKGGYDSQQNDMIGLHDENQDFEADIDGYWVISFCHKWRYCERRRNRGWPRNGQQQSVQHWQFNKSTFVLLQTSQHQSIKRNFGNQYNCCCWIIGNSSDIWWSKYHVVRPNCEIVGRTYYSYIVRNITNERKDCEMMEVAETQFTLHCHCQNRSGFAIILVQSILYWVVYFTALWWKSYEVQQSIFIQTLRLWWHLFRSYQWTFISIISKKT